MTPFPTTNQLSPPDAREQPDAPESQAPPCRWLGLDRLGVLQMLGAIALSLIALFSSYVHLTLFGRTIALQQQWGIVFIAASLATVVVDAQLASRSRLRAAQDAARVADEADREQKILRVRSEIEQIKNDTEQLRQENARYRQQRAREKAWRTSVEELFSLPESSSTPASATEPASNPSSP